MDNLTVVNTQEQQNEEYYEDYDNINEFMRAKNREVESLKVELEGLRSAAVSLHDQVNDARQENARIVTKNKLIDEKYKKLEVKHFQMKENFDSATTEREELLKEALEDKNKLINLAKKSKESMVILESENEKQSDKIAVLSAKLNAGLAQNVSPSHQAKLEALMKGEFGEDILTKNTTFNVIKNYMDQADLTKKKILGGLVIGLTPPQEKLEIFKTYLKTENNLGILSSGLNLWAHYCDEMLNRASVDLTENEEEEMEGLMEADIQQKLLSLSDEVH